jgi:hypothetical protein
MLSDASTLFVDPTQATFSAELVRPAMRCESVR